MVFLIFCIIIGAGAIVLALYAVSSSKKKTDTTDEFKTTSNDNYLVSFKVSYPLSNGTYRETKIIDVVVTADSPQLAKDLAKKKALSKVQITVTDVEIKT